MKLLPTFAVVVFAVCLLFGIQSSHGAIVTFTDRASFDLALPSAVIEDWDSFAAGTTFANGATVNGITYNSSTNISVVTDLFSFTTGPNGLGRTPIEFFEAGDTITFTFSTPIDAFGIDVNTFDLSAGGYKATTDLGDVASSGYDPFPGRDTGQFVGFTSDTAISSVTISAPGGFSYTLDTLRHNPIPEPTTLVVWSLLATLGISVGWRRRRRS